METNKNVQIKSLRNKKTFAWVPCVGLGQFPKLKDFGLQTLLCSDTQNLAESSHINFLEN